MLTDTLEPVTFTSFLFRRTSGEWVLTLTFDGLVIYTEIFPSQEDAETGIVLANKTLVVTYGNN